MEQDRPEWTVIFKQEKPGGVTYRIPSLIYIEQERRLLAFAEKRDTPSDTDANFLVMREGSIINGLIQWSASRQLSANLQGHRAMNPCPVYERNSKTLFLFYICVPYKMSEQHQIVMRRNAARLCLMTSTDGGNIWSPMRDLTELVIRDEIKNWATFAVGPGHGIQMKSGKLVIPAYAYCIQRMCHLPVSVCPHAFYFYSTDEGNTWSISEKLDKESCECMMAEIHDKENGYQLYCNARSTLPHRVEAHGKSDCADSFHQAQLAQQLIEQHHGCHGSVISFYGEVEEEPQTWLLFSHPTEKKRKNLGVYLNRHALQSFSWEQPWIIYHGPSGYSELAYCKQDKLFVCLVECGEEKEDEQISLAQFTIQEVLKALPK